MGQEGLLGSFEELVLLAVARKEDRAYGMTVRREIQERTGRDVAVGAVYATLERLVDKGLLKTWTADASQVRRGRARRYYRLLPDGARALQRAREVHLAMWEGLNPGSLRTDH